MTEAAGVPVGLAAAGANRNDCKLLEATIDSVPIDRPAPTPEHPQGVCLDKAPMTTSSFAVSSLEET